MSASVRPNQGSIWSDAVVEQWGDDWYVTVRHDDDEKSARQVSAAGRIIFDYNEAGDLIGFELLASPSDPFPYVGEHGSRHAYPGTLNGKPLAFSPREMNGGAA